MAERAIEKHRGRLRVTIVRPSIIISSYKEPIVGWTDTMDAGRTLILSIINGYLSIVKFKRESFLDVVPIDYVVNVILAASAFSSLEPHPSLNVVHATSSDLNPITLGQLIDSCNKFSRRYPSVNQFRDPQIKAQPSKSLYQTEIMLTEKIPAWLFARYANLPYFGSEALRVKA